MGTSTTPTFGDIKDIVREHLGRTTFPTNMLDKALDQGRRIVEQQGNWYWMREETYFDVVANQPIYPIVTLDNPSQQDMQPVRKNIFPPSVAQSASGTTTSTTKYPTPTLVQPVSIPGFKDVRGAAVKKPTDSDWNFVEVGGIAKEEADNHWSINDPGMPELLLFDNFDMLVYPPFPDQIYTIHLFYYRWTANPTSNLSSDELCSRFPEALEYAALAWAYDLELKDQQGAGYWRTLLSGKPNEIGNGGEIAKIRRHNMQRMRQDNMNMTPLTGQYQRQRRLRITQNIWLGSQGWR
jgi:hypothetical protein